MVEMLEVHVSEFIRVLVLLCLIQSSDYCTSIRGWSGLLHLKIILNDYNILVIVFIESVCESFYEVTSV